MQKQDRKNSGCKWFPFSLGSTSDKYTNRIKYTTDKIPKVINPYVEVKGVSKKEELEPNPIAIIVNSKATAGKSDVTCIHVLELLKL